MTITNTPAGHTGEDRDRRWQPALTEQEAARLGLAKKRYQALLAFALLVASEHLRLHTPRHLWEPTATQADHFTAEYIEHGEAQLTSALADEVDPQLDEVRLLIESTKAHVDSLNEDTLPIPTTESGSNHSVVNAVHLVEQHDRQIEEDEDDGKHIHRRVHPVLKWFGRRAPWFEALGMFAFVSMFLNVVLWRPQDDILGWTFALSVVIITVVGQIWLIHPAAEAHNHMREHAASGNRHEAAASRTRRNRYLGAAAAVTSVVTGSMILRGLAALSDADPSVTVIMVALAIGTGLLMPILAYLGVALDGSKASRERDALAQALNDDLEDDLATRESARRALSAAAEYRDTLNDETLPSICRGVQETVDQCYYPYNAVRMLLGELAGKPPSKTSTTVGRDSEGLVTGRIGTGIPGARNVNLAPLLDRCRRLASLEQQRHDLTTQLEAIPSHPWAAHRR